MNKLVMVTVLVLALASCTDAATAKKAAESQGFKDVVTSGYSFFGCSQDDTFHTKFSAVGLDGKPVDGVVCSSWLFKGATVRTY